MTLSKLSILTLILGSLSITSGIFCLKNPERASTLLKGFPRSLTAGYAALLIATVWFLIYLHTESMADFGPYRGTLTIFFVAMALGVGAFLKDFLAVRALAIIMLLLAKLMVDAARWNESDWRLVIVVWAYLLVLLGMWFTVSPWRMRDIIQWATASYKRLRILAAMRIAFGAFLLVLALTAFRNP